jgi:hypothetical protein
MRQDIDKVLCEHERSTDYGKTYKSVLRSRQNDLLRHAQYELLTPKQSMRRQYIHGRKEFGENLNILPGIIHKNLGRKWDDVFSELRKSFKPDSATHNHIYQHLWGYIYQQHEIFFKDGIMYSCSYGVIRKVSCWRGQPQYYIDENGCIAAYLIRPPAKPKRKDYRPVIVNAWRSFHWDGNKKQWMRALYRKANAPRLENVVKYVRKHTYAAGEDQYEKVIVPTWVADYKVDGKLAKKNQPVVRGYEPVSAKEFERFIAPLRGNHGSV